MTRTAAPKTTHLDADDLARLRAGTLAAEDERKIRSHLAEACPGCSRHVAQILVEMRERWGRRPIAVRPTGARPGLALDRDSLRSHEEAAAWEEAVAPGLAKSLAAWEEAEAFQVVAEVPAYQTYALASRLTEECRRGVFVDVVDSYRFGRLAVAVAAYSNEKRYGTGLRFDLQGEAALALANASRCHSRFYEARKALEMAEGFFERGTGDVSGQVQLASMKASVAKALGYEREAVLAVEEGARLLSGSGGQEIDLKLEVKLAVMTVSLEPVRSLRLSKRLACIIDQDRYPQLHFCARLGLAYAYYHLGRPQIAWMTFSELCSHSRVTPSTTYGDALDLTAMQFLVALGRLKEAKDRIRRFLSRHGHELSRGTAIAYHHGSLVALCSGDERLARKLASESSARFAMMGAHRLAAEAALPIVRH